MTAGDVIGYMGHTGYSKKENTNNIDEIHLHFGIQLIFDESQKDGNCEIWINPYQLTRFFKKPPVRSRQKGGQQDMAPDTGYERPAGGGVHAAERLEHAVRIP